MTTLATAATTMTAIASILSASSTIVATGIDAMRYLVRVAGELMDVAEIAFDDAVNAGSNKKAAVLAGLEAIAGAIGISWGDIKAAISGYIDVIKAAWSKVMDNVAIAMA